MTRSTFTKLSIVAIVAAIIVISGCFFITAVNQPATADESQAITMSIDVTLDETGYSAGDGPSAAITALLLPEDWTIQEVSFDGDYGPETMVFLPPDSVDIQAGQGTDYWYDSLAVYFPPTAGMDWFVYEGIETHEYVGGIETSVTYTYEVTTGAAGTFDLGYFVSTADWDLADTTHYDVNLGNTITVESTSAIEDNQAEVARKFALNQNFPNPFNPGTRITYEVERSTQVNITVYDLTGKKVAVLVNTIQNAGSHEVNFDATDLPSGIYIYKMTAGPFNELRKMTLIK